MNTSYDSTFLNGYDYFQAENDLRKALGKANDHSFVIHRYGPDDAHYYDPAFRIKTTLSWAIFSIIEISALIFSAVQKGEIKDDNGNFIAKSILSNDLKVLSINLKDLSQQINITLSKYPEDFNKFFRENPKSGNDTTLYLSGLAQEILSLSENFLVYSCTYGANTEEESLFLLGHKFDRDSVVHENVFPQEVANLVLKFNAQNSWKTIEGSIKEDSTNS